MNAVLLDVVVDSEDGTVIRRPPPLFSILHPISCLIVPLFLSSGPAFLRTVRYITYSGLLKEQHLWPSFSYVATPFFALCLPALICLNLLYSGWPCTFGLCVHHFYLTLIIQTFCYLPSPVSSSSVSSSTAMSCSSR